MCTANLSIARGKDLSFIAGASARKFVPPTLSTDYHCAICKTFPDEPYFHAPRNLQWTSHTETSHRKCTDTKITSAPVKCFVMGHREKSRQAHGFLGDFVSIDFPVEGYLDAKLWS
jgi:hypothetical protein